MDLGRKESDTTEQLNWTEWIWNPYLLLNLTVSYMQVDL